MRSIIKCCLLAGLLYTAALCTLVNTAKHTFAHTFDTQTRSVAGRFSHAARSTIMGHIRMHHSGLPDRSPHCLTSIGTLKTKAHTPPSICALSPAGRASEREPRSKIRGGSRGRPSVRGPERSGESHTHTHYESCVLKSAEHQSTTQDPSE